jgi:hypothetical protein
MAKMTTLHLRREPVAKRDKRPEPRCVSAIR